MRPSGWILCLLLGSALPATSRAAERVDLDNGLTVILEQRRVSPAVSVEVFVRAGRIDEAPGKGGTAHFVEHMMFRATSRRPAGGSELEAWRVGAQLRAYTHEDFTRYGILLPSGRLPLALDLLSDFLTSSSFVESEVEEERAVVLDEVRKRHADPEAWAWEELQGLALLPHPYGARISGTVRSVNAISREDLFGFYRRHYRPDRAILVLVGDFEREAALTRIRAAFDSWKGEGPPPGKSPSPPAKFGHYQEMTVTRDGTMPLVLASLALPSQLHPDYIRARFLKEILGGWITERLVVEKRVALAADVYITPMLGLNLLKFRLTLRSPSDAARARNELLGLLAEMVEPQFPYDGLEELADNFLSREILLAEDFETLAGLIGRAALTGHYEPEGRPEHLTASDRYRRVTKADLARVARTWFVPANLRILFLLPPGSAAPAPASLPEVTAAVSFPTTPPVSRVPPTGVGDAHARSGPPPRDSDATMIALSSGAVLIHLEREGAPLVAGAILLPAGSRYDPPGKEGLASLTLKALTLETEGRGQALRWRLYALGNSYDMVAKRDFAVISFTVPRERAEEALAMVVEMLKRPAFTDDAIEKARGRLVRQARRAEERISTFAAAAFRREVLGRSSYAHDHHGTPESLARIRAEDIRTFYREHFRPELAVLSLVGRIAPRHARALAERTLGGPPAAREIPGVPEARTPAGGPGRRRTHPHPSGRGYVIVGAAAPAYAAKDHAEVSLLRLALGWLAFDEFTEVRSNAYEAGALYDAFAETGTFGLYVGTSPAELPGVEKRLVELFAESARRGIPAELLDDSKGAWLGGTQVSSARSVSVAKRLAYLQATGRGYAAFEDIRERVEALTAEELRDSCRRLFVVENLVTTLVRPE